MKLGDGGERIHTHAADGDTYGRLCECSHCNKVERSTTANFAFGSQGVIVCMQCWPAYYAGISKRGAA